MFGKTGTGLQLAIVVAMISIGALLIEPSARSQGVMARMNVTNSSPQDEIKILRQQLLVLMGRVKVFEDKAGPAGGSADDARDRKLEQRLAAVEREQAKLAAGGAKGGAKPSGSDRPEGLTVVAPFLVVDDKGEPIMRVSAADGQFSRGVYAFDANGASVVHMGITPSGGRVYVSKPGESPAAVLAVAPDGPAIKLTNQNTKAAAIIRSGDLYFLSPGGLLLSRFGTKSESKGYLELNDSAGSTMVEAGMLESNKGYVLTNPYRASVDPRGDPSVLKGAGK